MTGADVTGVTLSTEQLQVSNARAAEKNLTQSAKFLLKDYRDIPGPFDRIVSVGMFEHVGVDFYESYFRHCAELLADDGVMVLHSIGRSDPARRHQSLDYQKYIFPGGYIPALSEIVPVIEKVGLLVCDIEILRLHYAETLKAWRERFMTQWGDAVRLYDERFARMWEFYLAISEMSFRKQNMMNLQIQITKRQGVTPMTRDYIAREEAKLRGRERGNWPRLQIAGGQVRARLPPYWRRSIRDAPCAVSNRIKPRYRTAPLGHPAGYLLHGADQPQQPSPFAVCCSPTNNLPSHRLFFRSPSRVDFNSGRCNQFLSR